MGYLTDLETAQEDYENLINTLNQQILALPDNPNITRLSTTAYHISLKGIGNNLAPEYHDFKKTYRLLVEWIEGMDIRNVRINLLKAVEKGKFRLKNTLYYLHPEVIENLKTIL